MENIKITCDSTCDLTRELYDRNHVEVISMGINLGENFLRDGVNITSEELFSFVEAHDELPKTSALSIGEYEDVFRGYTDQGYQVIHISLSSELSSSYQNACLAAQEVGNVYIVDSRNLSSGSGHLVLQASDMVNAGMAAEPHHRRGLLRPAGSHAGGGASPSVPGGRSRLRVVLPFGRPLCPLRPGHRAVHLLRV